MGAQPFPSHTFGQDVSGCFKGVNLTKVLGFCGRCALASKSDAILGSGQYRERFYERAVKKKVFSMPPTVLGS